jgi:hypothetical protein
MCEIKFRAWDTDSDGYRSDGTVGFDGSITSDWGHEKNHWVLEQFAGLRDKNRREIYAGDIVTDPRMDSLFCERPSRDCWWRGIVRFGAFSVRGGSGGHGEGPEYHKVIGWYYNTITTDYRHVDSIESKPLHGDVVVIGNIHENRGLIEQPEHSRG